MDENDEDGSEELLLDLQEAHEAALRALEALYRPSGPKRGFWYRVALGRAQNSLIMLYKQELQRRNQRGIDRGPAEPSVEDGIGGERE